MGEHPEAIVEHRHERRDVQAVYDEGLKFGDGAKVWNVRLYGLRYE